MKFKNVLLKKLIIYAMFIFIVCLFIGIYTLLIYKDVMKSDEKSIYIYSFILGALLFLILGLIKGLLMKENGLLEGMLSSVFIIFIILLFNFIINKTFTYFNLIKIIVYILSATIGGIIGVNISKKRE